MAMNVLTNGVRPTRICAEISPATRGPRDFRCIKRNAEPRPLETGVIKISLQRPLPDGSRELKSERRCRTPARRRVHTMTLRALEKEGGLKKRKWSQPGSRVVTRRSKFPWHQSSAFKYRFHVCSLHLRAATLAPCYPARQRRHATECPASSSRFQQGNLSFYIAFSFFGHFPEAVTAYLLTVELSSKVILPCTVNFSYFFRNEAFNESFYT